MSEPKFKPDTVVGKGWGPTDEEGVIHFEFDDLLPEIQLLLQDAQAAKERWAELKRWLAEDWPKTHYEYSVLERISELERGGE